MNLLSLGRNAFSVFEKTQNSAEYRIIYAAYHKSKHDFFIINSALKEPEFDGDGLLFEKRLAVF